MTFRRFLGHKNNEKIERSGNCWHFHGVFVVRFFTMLQTFGLIAIDISSEGWTCNAIAEQ